MESQDDQVRRGTKHLHDVGDGSGCTEIWEHLSDRRAENERSDDEEDDHQ
ncbi:hypothetical protein [Haladaptatus cibarius]|nr:hypothetical protein [Haladaptatus cibarius]